MNKTRKSSIINEIMQYPIITILFLILVLYFFLNVESDLINLQDVQINIRHTSPFLFIVIGQALVMRMGGFDLSVGAILSASAVIFASFNAGDMNSWLALGIAMILCVLIGATNGLLVAICKSYLPSTKSKWIGFFRQILPSIIVTLISMHVIRRGLSAIFGTSTFSLHDTTTESFQRFFSESVFFEASAAIWIPYLLLIMLCIFFNKFRIGKRNGLLGYNGDEQQSKKELLTKTLIVYIFSALCAGFAGILIAMRSFAGVFLLIGSTYEWGRISIAIVLISGICIFSTRGRIAGLVFGILTWATLYYGLIVLRAPPREAQIIIRSIMFILISINILQSVIITRFISKHECKEIPKP